MVETSISRDAGIAFLDETISETHGPDYEGDETYELANILKRLLVENGITPQEAAQQIDSFYEHDWLPIQPMWVRKKKTKGMSDFLATPYDLICDLGRVLHYDDVRQNTLIQLILELRKLPPRQVEIWEKDCIAYRDDAIFDYILHNDWYMQYLNETMPGTPSDVQESCDQYVNLASFIARCNSAGLLGDAEGYEYKCGNADIAEEIGDEFPRGNTRNGRILALANYILLAGSGIRDYYYRDPPDSDWGKRARHIWNRWKKKFEAIANGPDEDPKVKDAAKKAHGIMVEFDA